MFSLQAHPEGIRMSGNMSVSTFELDYRAVKWGNLETTFPLPLLQALERGAPIIFHVHSLVLEDLGNMAKDVMEIYFCPETINIYFTLLVNNCSEFPHNFVSSILPHFQII